ncbi:MAG TPA: redoxin domain-containing protein [Methylomirabilota bacterium]|nr:redoxin domain-containing protein [Methylomirabilota bacterium]
MKAITPGRWSLSWACLLLLTGFSGRAATDEVSNFALLDHQGRMHELRRTGGKAVVLFFTQTGCPIVRQSAPKLRALRDQFATRGVEFWLVNSSTADDRKANSNEAAELGIWHLPVLEDEAQGVARHLGVKRTAETFVISTTDWRVIYRGAIDDQLVEGAQKPQPGERYVEAALQEFLEGKPVTRPRTVARGCLIHYDGGDEADSTPVSYAEKVAPILAAKCVGCHSPGNIGSWSMSSHKKIKSMSSMIEEVLLTRRMPPWDADPHVGRFANNAALTVAETKTLLRWIHQGAPRGEGPDPLEVSRATPPAEWPLGEPDIVLRLPQPEQIPATGVLDYRHIEVRAGNTNEAWVTGLWVKPGNKKVVHHVIARLKEGGPKDHLGDRQLFAGWAPGATQGWLPKGSGKFLPKDARFDIEMHYTTCGTPETDQTEIGLYLAPTKPESVFEAVPLVNVRFEIPPGAPDAQAQAMYCFKKPATLHSVTPHMHLRGKWMKFDVLYPNGKKETVCSVPRYDFNWQLTYVLDQPRRLPAGTWVVLSGGFDNSPQNPANPDPKKFVHWGEQSWDEMFLGWYNVTWDPEPPSGTASLR